MVFSGDKVTIVSFVFVLTWSIECYTKTFYLNLCGRSYQKEKLEVNVWCLSTGIATFWRLYFYCLATNLEKHQIDAILKLPC